MGPVGAVGHNERGPGPRRSCARPPRSPRAEDDDDEPSRAASCSSPTPGGSTPSELAAGVATRLLAAGVGVCAPADDLVGTPLADVAGVEAVRRRTPTTSAALGCELVCVLGGDGTILRGAELSRGSGVPLLGVNLGHVGFLAEAEREDLDATVERIVSRDYTVEERMTLEVRADEDGAPVFSVVGAQRGDRREGVARADARAHRRDRRAPAVDLGVRRHRHGDAHRLHRLRVLGRRPGGLARRRGAAARADQRARALRPAGRRRPALPARRRGAARTDGSGVVWCDGRRAVGLPPGARIEVHRSDQPVRLARLSDGGFTDRLVEKFDLPVAGLARRRAARCMSDTRPDGDA